MNFQSGILEPISDHAVFLEFDIVNQNELIRSIGNLSDSVQNSKHVVGIGSPLANILGLSIPALETFPDYSANGLTVPSTQTSLLVVLRGDNKSDLTNKSESLESLLLPAFVLVSKIFGFKHEDGRDLTGYEDGTENPTGQAAIAAAILTGAGGAMDDSSFVAVQKWLHDFSRFNAMSRVQQDDTIGRRRDTNDEFDSPDFAHVKRTAQESFNPEAFVVRRSMPWSDTSGCGLMFVAYGCSFYAFDVQMKRMTGCESGIIDGLFRFTEPVSGGFLLVPACSLRETDY